MAVAIGGGAAFSRGGLIAGDDLRGGDVGAGAVFDPALDGSIGRRSLRSGEGREDEEEDKPRHCSQDS